MATTTMDETSLAMNTEHEAEGPGESVTPFTEIEQEAIVLNAVVGMVETMVNPAIFGLPEGDRKETNLLPQTAETLRQFAILLRDFLSPLQSKGKGSMPFGLPKPPSTGRVTDHTTLFYLKRVCDNPIVGKDVEFLRHHTEHFADWLETEAHIEKVWLANIGKEIDLKIKRIEFIRMSGDIGKHNFLRLGGQVKVLRRILHENGLEIDESQGYATLPDCRDWFHEHLLAYHASTIAEYLNNIRYSIRLYVEPAARSRYRTLGTMHGLERYTYDRPTDVVNEFAWSQYYDLLNGSRHTPSFPPFSVNPILRGRY